VAIIRASGNVHEQCLVVGAEVVTGGAIAGEAALESEVVAMSGMGEDGHGTAEAREVKELAGAVAGCADGGRCVSEVVVEERVLFRDGQRVEPGH
jgi:hypothetical protein